MSSCLHQGLDKLQTDFFSCPKQVSLLAYLKVLLNIFFLLAQTKE